MIETNHIKVLLDCGHTKKYLTQALQSRGIEPTQVDALIITHNHIDHVSQLKLFKDRPVFAPHVLANREDTIILEPFQWITLGDLRIWSIPLSHDAQETFGYVIKHNEETLVYITDTGYIRETDFEILSNADYYIFESNHDIEMLMSTSRPYNVKKRILSTNGHLSNQDSAQYLSQLVGTNTKSILLAHLSSEANTERQALETLVETFESQQIRIDPNLKIHCAKQNEPVTGGSQ